jgi:hypothetical protein
MKLDDKWFRLAAYYLVKEKVPTRMEVGNLFGTSRKSVETVIKRFDETGCHKDRA